MFKKTFMIISITVGVIGSVLLANGLILAAWTGPASNPPGSNVAAPVNIGSDTQLKIGALGIGGILQVVSLGIFENKIRMESETQSSDARNIVATKGYVDDLISSVGGGGLQVDRVCIQCRCTEEGGDETRSDYEECSPSGQLNAWSGWSGFQDRWGGSDIMGCECRVKLK